jgi:alkanesulfonate monooxygenase SsuD/methylene tetrahydromethanopterin reductase-like flavin-dependent oxidoreductase (luciferase family)
MAASEDVRQTLAGLSPEKRALLALKLRRQAGAAESAREGWLEGERREVCLGYWRGRLAAAPGLDLPADAGASDSNPALVRRQARRTLGLSRLLVEAVARLGRAEGVGTFEVLLTAWAVLLARWTGAADLLIGTPMGGNPVGLRLSAAGDPPFRGLLRQARDEVAEASRHADLPFDQLADALGGRTGGPAGDLFQVMLVVEEPGAASKVSPAGRMPEMLLGVVAGEGRLHSYLDYQSDRLTDAGAMRALHHFRELLAAATARPERRLSQLAFLTEAERHQLTVEWSEASGSGAEEETASVSGLFDAAVRRSPDAVALACGTESRTYGELARRVILLAQALRRRGFGPGAVASVEVEEPFDRIAGILAVLQAGGAWLAMPEPATADPFLRLDGGLLRSSEDGLEGQEERFGSPEPDSPACLTEARVGLERAPVPVSHRALAGRLRAFDGLVGSRDLAGETFLAAADISADGALAWLWPLSRGARVRLLPAPERHVWGEAGSLGDLDFSLFFFAGDGASGSPEKYRLLLESARFADREGFAAIWTPERHFHPFGGLYPNPAVTGAALAEATRRVQIRAGSLVIPLHDLDEAAREWAEVDAIAGGGRVGIAFASGWHVDDFVLLPANYAGRREAMDQGIERLRALWPGELPFWITSSGNVETFAKAGRLGAGVLTNLLGQGLDAVAEKLAAYRAARAEAGHAPGSAALMLHTFVGDDLDEVRETVRDPFCRYLRGFSDLFRQLARSLNYKAQDELNEADVDYLMSFAFQRYFETASLCGTPESCLAMLRRARDAGVDEIACLIDFGVDEDAVLASLHHLAELRRLCRERTGRMDADFGLAALAGEVTALVGTRSLLGRLGEDPGFPALLGGLRLLVADRQAPLPAGLSGFSSWGSPEAGLAAIAPQGEGRRLLGRPLPGTSLHLLSASGDPVPVGVSGEVCVGGDGLAAGYPACPGRTAERFVPDSFSSRPGGRLFRTGQRAVRRADGSVALPARRTAMRSGAAR